MARQTRYPTSFNRSSNIGCSFSGSVPRRPRTDRPSRRVDVAARAVIVGLRAVRVGGRMGRHVSARAGGVARGRVAVRIRARAVSLRMDGGGSQRQRRSQDDLLHSQSPIGFYCAATQPQ
jgi:hypothetical protein